VRGDQLAGLELRLENWAGAVVLAERAVVRNRDDVLAWRLLATSRFLAGRSEAALDVWNHIGEPRLDIVKIDGLARTPYRTVYDSLRNDRRGCTKSASPDGPNSVWQRCRRRAARA
jgi:hypothetical protein